MGKCRHYLWLFLLLASGNAFGQFSLCSLLDSLISANQYTLAKQLAYGHLSKNVVQNDCLFQSTMYMFENQATASSQDSLQKLFLIWQAICPDPCLPKAIYLQVLRKSYGPTTYHAYCEVFNDLYRTCPVDRIDTSLKPYAIPCENLRCVDLDSLFQADASMVNLEEAKQWASLLSQRECGNSSFHQQLQEKILKKEPSFNAYFTQGKAAKERGNLTLSQNYFTQAEKWARTPEQKSACYLALAETCMLQKNHAKAKDFAVLACGANPKNTESFLFLAMLFQRAEMECGFVAPEQLAALYLLIAEYSKLGGDMHIYEEYMRKSGAKRASKLSSTTREVKLGCFIKETVILNK